MYRSSISFHMWKLLFEISISFLSIVPWLSDKKKKYQVWQVAAYLNLLPYGLYLLPLHFDMICGNFRRCRYFTCNHRITISKIKGLI